MLLAAITLVVIAMSLVTGPAVAQEAGAETAEAATTVVAEPVNLAPLGAGMAILSIIGPALGIGILAGMSSSAIGRNPDAGEQIRSLAVIMAAFAEGLGVIALVVGLLIMILGQ
jgi:F-type H+-transporting ATPase subunit c